MTEKRFAPRQAAVTIALIGGLVGFGLGALVTYLPRDPFGYEPAAMSSIPTVYVHAFGIVMSFVFAAGFVAVYGQQLAAAIDDQSQHPSNKI